MTRKKSKQAGKHMSYADSWEWYKNRVKRAFHGASPKGLTDRKKKIDKAT